jgi:hypothetical protein
MNQALILIAAGCAFLAGAISEALVGGGDLHPYATFWIMVGVFIVSYAVLYRIFNPKKQRRLSK